MSFVKQFIEGAKIIAAKMQTKLFWVNFTKVALPFFILVTLISILLNSWEPLFAGDFEQVNQVNFANDKWQSFWGYKLVFCAFYGCYVTIKKMT